LGQEQLRERDRRLVDIEPIADRNAVAHRELADEDVDLQLPAARVEAPLVAVERVELVMRREAALAEEVVEAPTDLAGLAGHEVDGGVVGPHERLWRPGAVEGDGEATEPPELEARILGAAKEVQRRLGIGATRAALAVAVGGISHSSATSP